MQLSPAHWNVGGTPPLAHSATREPLAQRLDVTLAVLGVVPGSTLHFRRSE